MAASSTMRTAAVQARAGVAVTALTHRCRVWRRGVTGPLWRVDPAGCRTPVPAAGPT